MLSRVTTQMTMASAQATLGAGASRVADLQERAASLKNILRPSDDPQGTSDAMGVRAQQAAVAQYSRNADDAAGWLSVTDSALGDVVDRLNSARDLVVQGGNNGILTPDAREGLAVQITAIKQDLLTAGNQKYVGRAVFAGNSADGTAISQDFQVSGDGTNAVSRRLSDQVTVRADTSAASVFGAGDSSVFSLLDRIAGDLRAGADVASDLTALDGRLTTVRTMQADVGVRHATVIAAQTTIGNRATALESQRSVIEDRDVAKSVLDLQTAQNTYQVALGVTARVIKTSLMDYLS